MSDKGSVWLYGEKKIGECGLSTDIAWLSTENWWDTGAFYQRADRYGGASVYGMA